MKLSLEELTTDLLAEGVLLDTCAVIWLAGGTSLSPPVQQALVTAALTGIFVSPVSAWEVGLLSNPRGNRPALQFLPDPKTWFAAVMARTGIREAPLTPGIATDSSFLPGGLHGDPADRLLIATARHMRVPLVTRDVRIIAYAGQGHLDALPC